MRPRSRAVVVLRETSGLMVEAAREVAKDYPDIPLWDTNIDAQVMWLLKNPRDYGVLVTSNMFGDILSDLCAQLVGGLGFASSGNIGDEYAVFEPTHGSAPKYAGQYKVNPMAMLLAAKLMLDWLGESDKAAALESAIAGVVKDGPNFVEGARVHAVTLSGGTRRSDVTGPLGRFAIGDLPVMRQFAVLSALAFVLSMVADFTALPISVMRVSAIASATSSGLPTASQTTSAPRSRVSAITRSRRLSRDGSITT